MKRASAVGSNLLLIVSLSVCWVAIGDVVRNPLIINPAPALAVLGTVGFAAVSAGLLNLVRPSRRSLICSVTASVLLLLLSLLPASV